MISNANSEIPATVRRGEYVLTLGAVRRYYQPNLLKGFHISVADEDEDRDD